jgi:hypothetical protein
LDPRRRVAVIGLQPDQVRQERVVARPALQQAVERSHQPANPSPVPWKPPWICKHDASMPKSSRQVLFVKSEVVRGVLGDNDATLSRCPGQDLRIIQVPEVWQSSGGYYIVTSFPELLRYGG